MWQGMIYVAPGAQKTDGYQANRNLVLSEGAAPTPSPAWKSWRMTSAVLWRDRRQARTGAAVLSEVARHPAGGSGRRWSSKDLRSHLPAHSRRRAGTFPGIYRQQNGVANSQVQKVGQRRESIHDGQSKENKNSGKIEEGGGSKVCDKTQRYADQGPLVEGLRMVNRISAPPRRMGMRLAEGSAPAAVRAYAGPGRRA